MPRLPAVGDASQMALLPQEAAQAPMVTEGLGDDAEVGGVIANGSVMHYDISEEKTEDTLQAVMCPICQKLFSTQQDVTLHQQQEHMEVLGLVTEQMEDKSGCVVSELVHADMSLESVITEQIEDTSIHVVGHQMDPHGMIEREMNAALALRNQTGRSDQLSLYTYVST